MVTIATPKVRKILGGIRLPLPNDRKGWAMLLLAVPVVFLLTAGLAQIFHLDLNGSDSRQAPGPVLEWRDIIGVLNRYAERPVDSGETPSLEVLLATPHYFGALRRQPPANAISEPSLLFYVTETVHIDELPAQAPSPLLRVGPVTRPPDESVVLAESEHHRSTLLRFAVTGSDRSFIPGDSDVIELEFPAADGTIGEDSRVEWTLPLVYSADYSSAEVAHGTPTSGLVTPALSGVAVLAIMGGLLAAMWPCLFQLTAYFIPAMAGMSMQEASGVQGLKPRVGVVKIALFFVLGFTIIYTIAGAAIGYGSQQLSNMDSFYYWQRYISIGAGVILFGLALRVAARVRAPLVCKMPIVSKMANKGN